MDNASEADELDRILRTYLDEKADRRGGRWVANGSAYDVRRPTDETVVLTMGDPAFVDNATVTGSDGGFTVRVRGNSD